MTESEKGRTIPYEALVNALFENYESICDLDLETSGYSVYCESETGHSLNLTKNGGNFFVALAREVDRAVVPDDRSYVMRMLSREVLEDGVRSKKRHSFVYRTSRDGRQVYHQLRATLANIDGKDHVLMGVRDVDEVLRQNVARENELSFERQKSANYLAAILATAAACIEANLSTDSVLERSADMRGRSDSRLGAVPSPDEIPSYTAFRMWIAENLICENREKFLSTSSRNNLLACFEKDGGRTSVLFSAMTTERETIPCRAVFYLYREKTTGDVHVLCVIYDLTEQQQQEKKLEELKTALELSRIYNSASQMRPHFIYNALGSIQEIMLDDPGRAAVLLEDFTMHLRGCIKAMDGDHLIPFSQELDNIVAYANIEKMRLGDRLDMRYELDETQFDVLSLSIQPLVENAIRHGVYRRGPQGGTVTLRTWAEDRAWIVQVEDTGVGFDIAAYEESVSHGKTDSTGLRNIRFRLEHIMGASLDAESTPGRGTTMTVRIPKGGAG